jgi:putative chitinase
MERTDMSNEIYESMIQQRGREYRSDQIKAWSHYREPVDHSPGRLAGNSRVWGDASPEVQSRVIDTLIEFSRNAGLTPRETAHVLAIARIESGFNPDAAAGTTSASGLGQFIDQTGRHYNLNNQNRFSPDAQADALVAHFIDNRNLAIARGQDEAYIYKYHHDGPTRDYGGLALSNREVAPYLNEYETFVRQRLQQEQDPVAPQQTNQTPAQPSSNGPRSFDDVMKVMLPPQNGVSPHVTGHYGEHRSKGDHGGVDFNYVGGQNGVNLQHPTIHAPISGKVTFVGGQYGTIKILDAQGNSHEILHTHSQSVKEGQQIAAGQPIGTMGGRGPDGANDYAQHVHYQLKDSTGKLKSPEEFWNKQQDIAVTSPASRVAEPRTQAASGEVIKHGEKNDSIRQLQDTLNKFGYRDKDGRALREDGGFGDRTKEAVQAYQQAHGLKPDGIVGPQTLEALKKSQSAPLLSDPRHPNNALYQQAVKGLEQLGPQAFKNRNELENAAGATVFEAKASGLTRIDHVLQSTNGTGVFAVQGALNDPAHSRVYLDKSQAAAEPIEKSTAQVQQEIQPQLQAQQEREQRRAVVM